VGFDPTPGAADPASPELHRLAHGFVALDANGIHHPDTPRGRSFVYTPYRDIIHLACSSRALWLSARRSVYVLPRHLFADAAAPERLARSLLDRIARRPGGEAQLARMGEIEAEARRPARARATWGLALVCLAIYPLQLLVGSDLEEVGYYNALLVADGDWWRLITANLLHAHPSFPAHLVLNVLGLLALGTLVERPLGAARTLVVMGVSGIAAMVASGWAHHARVVGVSGVVFGLLGAVTWLELRLADRLPAWWRVPRRALYVMIAISAALAAAVPFIAWAAHVGGFVAGAAAATLLCSRGVAAQAPAWLRAGGGAVVGATAVALAVCAAELARPGAYAPQLMARIARLPGMDALSLNEYAWTIAIDPDSSRELLESALLMAERAVEETDRGVPEILDTLAELQFLLGESDAAVATIYEAIEMRPFEPYYQRQLRRFLGERPRFEQRDPQEDGPAIPDGPGIRV
jgi:membrane associated rhomboid family serine protease